MGEDQTGDGTRIVPVPRGFLAADNAYFDLLFGRVSPTAHYCLMYVLRNTIGYHRPSVRLSFKQIGDALGLTRNTVMRALRELEGLHIVASDDGPRGRTQVRTYTTMPPEAWTLPTDAQTSANNELVATSAENTLASTSVNNALDVSKIALVAPQTSAKIDDAINTQRNTVSKDTSSPTPDGVDGESARQVTQTPPKPSRLPKPLPPESDAVRLAACLRDAILAHSPQARDARAALAPVKLQQWARPVDLMLRLDGRTPESIRAVIDFATHDTFWQPNILSPGKLREKYDTLEARMRSVGQRTSAPPSGRKPPGPPDVNLGAIPRLAGVDWDAVRAQAAEAEKRKDGA